MWDTVKACASPACCRHSHVHAARMASLHMAALGCTGCTSWRLRGQLQIRPHWPANTAKRQPPLGHYWRQSLAAAKSLAAAQDLQGEQVWSEPATFLVSRPASALPSRAAQARTARLVKARAKAARPKECEAWNVLSRRTPSALQASVALQAKDCERPRAGPTA